MAARIDARIRQLDALGMQDVGLEKEASRIIFWAPLKIQHF